MACSIEMQFCERCGREVPLYFIRVVRDEDDEPQYACEECAGKSEKVPVPVPPQPDCA
ncbi:MAG TPA: hypothetical protein VF707_04950 [Ardenticatenaceae bacterium]|jgi:DNA-directed RNA polymerase subunit RPC12/RpoP